MRAPGLVATMLSAMPQEHERGLGGWQAEWDVLPELVRVTASAATSTADLLEGLIVRTEAMERSLANDAGSDHGRVGGDGTGAPRRANPTAHGLVDRAARRALDDGCQLRGCARAGSGNHRHRSIAGAIADALEPADYLGVSAQFVAACLPQRTRRRKHDEVRPCRRPARGIAWRADGPVDAPALLLLGSLGTTSDIWRPQIQPLSERYRVVRLDTRGHGQSDATAGTVALDDLGADAVSVLDAAGVERVTVCGVSLGGMTAMWLAAHVPDRVRSLVAVSTGLKIGARSMWEERIRQVRAGGTESIADASMGRWFTERVPRCASRRRIVVPGDAGRMPDRWLHQLLCGL